MLEDGRGVAVGFLRGGRAIFSRACPRRSVSGCNPTSTSNSMYNPVMSLREALYTVCGECEILLAVNEDDKRRRGRIARCGSDRSPATKIPEKSLHVLGSLKGYTTQLKYFVNRHTLSPLGARHEFCPPALRPPCQGSARDIFVQTGLSSPPCINMFLGSQIINDCIVMRMLIPQ